MSETKVKKPSPGEMVLLRVDESSWRPLLVMKVENFNIVRGLLFLLGAEDRSLQYPRKELFYVEDNGIPHKVPRENRPPIKYGTEIGEWSRG